MNRYILHDLFRNILMVVIILLLTISAAGAAQNRGLAVPSNALPTELKDVLVQDSYTGSGANAVGEIQSVVGHVVVFREDKQYAYFAAPKDKLFERDVIYTLKDSRCRFQLFSSDTATMADNTRILIKSYLNNRSTGIKSTSFVMKKGKAMFYALRLFVYKGSSMEVETPTAVSGVRGTKWGIEVIEGQEVASLPIIVADASNLGAFRQLAQANTGGVGGSTIIHSFEGTVFVDSVPPGQSISLNSGQSLQSGVGGLGNPYPTPPGVSQQFQSDTSASGGSSSGNSGSEGGAGIGSGTTTDSSSVVQNQNQQLQTRPTNRIGYYVGMLTDIGSGVYSNTYFSNPRPKDLTNDDFARSLQPSSITPTIWQETGYNAYLTWGYWTQSSTWWDAGQLYAFDNKGYYVAGDVTAVMPTSISGTYSGIANGTVWNATGGTNYSGGTFSMDVAFAGGTGNVSNFNVSLGAPATAGVSVIFPTGGPITGNSFSMTGGTGTINGTAYVGGGSAYGSFYGPDGKMVGGVWQIGASGYDHANGNFIGSKP